MTPFTYKVNTDKVKDRYLFQGGALEGLENKEDEELVRTAVNNHF